MKKDCWSLNKKGSKPQGNIANTSNDGNAMVCVAVTTTGKKFADVCILDSAVTFHMTSRREWSHLNEPIPRGYVFSCND